MSLLIIGTVAFDTVETPYGKVERALGGSGTFASLAAAYYTRPRLVGVVGEDFPQEYIDLLASRGVDIRGIEHAAGKSFFWHGRYEQDINIRETLVTELNVLETFDPKLPADYLDSRYIFLANIDPNLQLKVLDQTPAAVLTMADTMNLWIDITRDALEQVLRRVDIILLNDSEARQLCGTPNLIKAARDILAKGPKAVILKKGEHGVMMFTDQAVFSLPAFPLQGVKDPTGAGDAFAGGFIGYLAGLDVRDDAHMRRALAVGTATASLCCEDFSIERFKTADRQAVSGRIAQIAAATAVDYAPLFGA
jgi:sugar/nucleoside kinase (ribokinase family)